jgi:N-acyl-D-amino-acid deacylase
MEYPTKSNSNNYFKVLPKPVVMHLAKCFLIALTSCASTIALSQDFDLLITGGKIVDGSGNSWFYGDVGVKDGKVAAIGNLSRATASKKIDATGLIVAPGFIDVHTHIETNDLLVPSAPNFLFDGVTSVVTGNCGGSNTEIAKYFARLDSVKMGINVATLVGHNSVRRAVMGDAQRDPTATEQKLMEDLVATAMAEGAVGLSTGLIYVPGTYSKTPEVIGLAKSAAIHNGVYASHIRDEGDHVTDAIEEAVNIGRVNKMPVEISHFKVTYKPNWGRSNSTIEQVEKARRDGIDVTVDQYPYVASSTTLNTLLPTWAFSGGSDSVQIRLRDTGIRKRIKTEMLKMLKGKLVKNYSYAVVARYAADTLMNGKTNTEVNLALGKKSNAENEAETIMDMVAKGSAQMVYFSMNEDDLRNIMRYPYNMFASDAGIIRYGSGVPHPRGYGTNARVLGMFVREQKVLRLEEAIRRMTSLPAQKFKLQDRGFVRPGMAADIVVFDENKVGDLSTFSKPHAYSAGFRYVLVNGQLAIENEKLTTTRSGTVLYGPGFVRNAP